MKHTEGFLKLVDDAKSRVREVSVADTQERMRENTQAKLIDVREDKDGMRRTPPGQFISAKASSSEILRRPCPTKKQNSFCTAAAAIVRRSPQTHCNTWVIQTCFRWRAAGKRGRKKVGK